MDAVDELLLPWWEPIGRLLGDDASVYDAHTHIGQHDPDGLRQTTDELLTGLEPLRARAVVFPMHEPDGYPPANDAVLEAAAGSERLVAFCRVDPRMDAVSEACRCLDAGARGIKLHPRAEEFTLDEPAVTDLIALAHERRVPVLIHAGRGIPALGRHSLELATRYPDARLILAHAAVSDLGWLWEEMPAHPNLLIDTSWWSPGDLTALFTLVPSGQILWASDSPYGRSLTSAVMQLRFAIQAGIGSEALRSIVGGQTERLLAGEELEQHGRPAAEAEPVSPHLERIVSHLVGAIGAALYEGDPAELVSLARLACDIGTDDPAAELVGRVEELLTRSVEMTAGEQPGAQRFPPSVRLQVAAMAIARTPAAPSPSAG